MNEYVVIGIEDVSYPSKKTGEIINGYRFYLTYESKKVEGLACEVVWVSGGVDIPDVEVGDKIELFYNQFGKVSKMCIA